MVNIKTLTASELLSYDALADIAFSFYDNEAKANQIEDEERYKKATEKMGKYSKIREQIFEEIELRLDQLYKDDKLPEKNVKAKNEKAVD